MDVFFFMIKYRTFVSEEKKVICASLQFLSSMEGTFDKIPGWENLGVQQRFSKPIITSAPCHTKN